MLTWEDGERIMKEMKHTPGPWIFGRTGDDKRLILGGPYRSYACSVQIHQTPRHMGLDDEPIREANAARIVACVNALEGIENPSAFVAASTEAHVQAVLLLNDERDARRELVEALEPFLGQIGYAQRNKSNGVYCDQVDRLNAALAKVTK